MSSPGAFRGLVDRSLAVLAFAIGGGSLLLFGAFLLEVGLPLAGPGHRTPSALLLDAGLSLLFFLQHSLMLRRGFRQRLASIVERRRHGVLYALASGLVLTALLLLWRRGDPRLYALDGAWRWILHGVQLLALASVLWGWRALGGFDPFGITILPRGAEGRPPPLAIRGPYRWVRHPLYLAFLVAAWATPVLTADRLLFNVLWSAWVVVGCRLEERDLVAAHGDAYRDYQCRVPMLLPWPVRTPR